MIDQRESFEFRVKLMRGRASREVESIVMPNAEGCRSCLCREFQATGTWWYLSYLET